MAANFAWGIDVGNRALKAVKLVRNGDQLQVDDFDIIEHETVLSHAGDNKEDLIRSALASFVQRHPGKGGQYSIGVSGQASFARFIKLPPVEPKKIPEIVRFEAIQQIPFPLDDVEWSYQLFQSEESPDVEVGIFAMRKELVNHQISYYTDFDLNVQVVQMSPLAVYNAMYHDNRLNGTTMIIDLGAENTDLIICDSETIWLRSIPIGGNNFTDALVKAFKLSFAKAEDLKRNAATSKYARQIFQAMRPIFADLVAEIQRSVGFYASVHRDSRIKKVLALGGTFKLPGLQKYLQQNLQLDVERLDTISAAPSAESKLAPNFNENILSVVSAYGLAIQAMGMSKINSSLLPAKIRREKMWREKTPIFGAAAALFAAGLGVGVAAWWVNDMAFNNPANADARSRIGEVLSKAQGLDGEWSNIERAADPARQKIIHIQGLQDYRSLWPQLLNDIQSALPQAGKPELASVDLQKIKEAVPKRDQRQLVLIDKMVANYQPDISGLIEAPDITRFAAKAGGQPPQVPAGATPPSDASAGAPRGFLITIECTTPFAKGDALIDTQVLPALRKIKPSPADRNSKDKKYQVVKAQSVQQLKIRHDTTRMNNMKTEYQNAITAFNAQHNVPGGGGGGGGGGRFDEGGDFRRGGLPAPAVPNAVPGAPDDMAPFRDRVTGEVVLDDWMITLVVLVQLDPPPPAPPPEAAQASAQ